MLADRRKHIKGNLPGQPKKCIFESTHRITPLKTRNLQDGILGAVKIERRVRRPVAFGLEFEGFAEEIQDQTGRH